MRIIDADGHVMDGTRMDELANYMPKGNQRPVFPVLDHLHFTFLRPERAGTFGNPDAGDWVEFLDDVGIDWTVVYPTSGLAVGRIVSIDWAVAACRAYNNWLHDRYPNLHVGFLEGGATWVPFLLDRMKRSHHGHLQLDLNGDFIAGPRPDEGASGYFVRLVKEGRIFVGFDCDDEGLGYSIQRAGREAFLFASDYPHESFSAETCRHEVDELLERDDLTDEDKQAVLATNAERFYGAS